MIYTYHRCINIYDIQTYNINTYDIQTYISYICLYLYKHIIYITIKHIYKHIIYIYTQNYKNQDMLL